MRSDALRSSTHSRPRNMLFLAIASIVLAAARANVDPSGDRLLETDSECSLQNCNGADRECVQQIALVWSEEEGDFYKRFYSRCVSTSVKLCALSPAACTGSDESCVQVLVESEVQWRCLAQSDLELGLGLRSENCDPGECQGDFSCQNVRYENGNRLATCLRNSLKSCTTDGCCPFGMFCMDVEDAAGILSRKCVESYSLAQVEQMRQISLQSKSRMMCNACGTAQGCPKGLQCGLLLIPTWSIGEGKFVNRQHPGCFPLVLPACEKARDACEADSECVELMSMAGPTKRCVKRKFLPAGYGGLEDTCDESTCYGRFACKGYMGPSGSVQTRCLARAQKKCAVSECCIPGMHCAKVVNASGTPASVCVNSISIQPWWKWAEDAETTKKCNAMCGGLLGCPSNHTCRELVKPDFDGMSGVMAVSLMDRCLPNSMKVCASSQDCLIHQDCIDLVEKNGTLARCAPRSLVAGAGDSKDNLCKKGSCRNGFQCSTLFAMRRKEDGKGHFVQKDICIPVSTQQCAKTQCCPPGSWCTLVAKLGTQYPDWKCLPESVLPDVDAGFFRKFGGALQKECGVACGALRCSNGHTCQTLLTRRYSAVHDRHEQHGERGCYPREMEDCVLASCPEQTQCLTFADSTGGAARRCAPRITILPGRGLADGSCNAVNCTNGYACRHVLLPEDANESRTFEERCLPAKMKPCDDRTCCPDDFICVPLKGTSETTRHCVPRVNMPPHEIIHWMDQQKKSMGLCSPPPKTCRCVAVEGFKCYRSEPGSSCKPTDCGTRGYACVEETTDREPDNNSEFECITNEPRTIVQPIGGSTSIVASSGCETQERLETVRKCGSGGRLGNGVCEVDEQCIGSGDAQRCVSIQTREDRRHDDTCHCVPSLDSMRSLCYDMTNPGAQEGPCTPRLCGTTWKCVPTGTPETALCRQTMRNEVVEPTEKGSSFCVYRHKPALVVTPL